MRANGSAAVVSTVVPQLGHAWAAVLTRHWAAIVTFRPCRAIHGTGTLAAAFAAVSPANSQTAIVCSIVRHARLRAAARIHLS